MSKGTQEDQPARPSRLDISTVMELQQNNMAAMMRSWLILANGLGAVAARQQEFAAATLEDMTEMMAAYRTARRPQEAMARQVEFAKKTMDATVATARDIAKVMAKSGADVAGVARRRIGAEGAAWLSDPARSVRLVELVASKLPPTLAAIDKSGLPSFVGDRVRTQLQQVEILSLPPTC